VSAQSRWAPAPRVVYRKLTIYVAITRLYANNSQSPGPKDADVEYYVPHPQQGVTILLVEDNPTDAELCLRSLKKRNITNDVVWLQDGAEALDYLFCRGVYEGRPSDHKPTVVLLDLRLPKIDGKEVLRQIKADDKLKSIPVVVLTSSGEDRDIAECYTVGANSFVVKPIEFGELAETVARLGYYWSLINTPPQRAQ
jgi:CheY-like chemotaxis protein